MNLRGQICDKDGSVDWNNITFKEQTHRARYNGDSSHYSNMQHEEILNLRKLLESRTKILKENEDHLVSRESLLEQAYVAIEQLQVQCSTLIEERLSIENELFSTNSKLNELEQQHTATIQRVNEFSNENLRFKSELDDKTRQCIDAERFQCEADKNTSTLEKTLAQISSLIPI
jgi:hypothetical protein